MLTGDYAPHCFWTADTPLPDAPGDPLPAAADVVIIGSGYTGLTAARETALAGRSTLVVDSGAIGGGCSARNGGQVGFSLKPSFAVLSARHGAEIAGRIYREAAEALEDLRVLVATEQLDCDWRDVGSLLGAHTRRAFDAIVRDAESQPRGLEQPFTIVSRGDLYTEVETPLYHGGVVYPRDAAIHPVRLVRALCDRAVAAGVTLRSNCAVRHIDRTPSGFDVVTTGGRVAARQVLIATNGYTGAFAPWQRRRILPIGSYIIATEPLDRALLARLLPRGRNVSDTRRVVVYFRPSPDGTRILFGGRASAGEVDVTRCVPRLRAMLGELFPPLARVRVSHAWMGFVGFTFDTLAHLGEHEGLYYCMGYCGQGITSATYYGRKIGLTMAGRPGGETVLTGLRFQSRPYYYGNPWFVPAAVLGYRISDALGL
jgi:glycine/D-amino acid oxidase-like deaminating enzyme